MRPLVSQQPGEGPICPSPAPRYGPNVGRLWDEMDRRQRVPIGDLNRQGIPERPGVYAMYHGGKRIYVGKAGNLQNRIWKAHCGQSKGLSNSAFRRNVAEHFGLATAAEIKKGLYRLTPEELARVRAFIESCEIAWITRRDEPEAVALEIAMKTESLPPLTKI